MSKLPQDKGEGFLELALVLVLVAIVLIVMLVLLGPQIESLLMRFQDLFSAS